MTASTPCIPWDGQGEHCLAALLHGTSCCPHGDCVLCEEQQQYMRRAGCHELDVARSWVRSRLGRLDGCPSCGFPPPPALAEIPPLPRFDRSDRVLASTTRCRYCDRRILGARRRYCDRECWSAFVVWSRRMRRQLARV